LWLGLDGQKVQNFGEEIVGNVNVDLGEIGCKGVSVFVQMVQCQRHTFFIQIQYIIYAEFFNLVRISANMLYAPASLS
jgi:hypothetical protein